MYAGSHRKFLAIWSLDLHCICKMWYHALCFSLPYGFLAPAPASWANSLCKMFYIFYFYFFYHALWTDIDIIGLLYIDRSPFFFLFCGTIWCIIMLCVNDICRITTRVFGNLVFGFALYFQSVVSCFMLFFAEQIFSSCFLG